jgi:hypothetical protein
MDNIIPKTISKKQASDTGMAVILILLIVGFWTKNMLYFKLAVPVTVLNMTVPMLYYPLAIVWLGFSNLLGSIVSKILLTVVFFIVVFPMGVFRKLLGKDPLQLNGFRKAKNSVMKDREHTFSSKDIERPY